MRLVIFGGLLLRLEDFDLFPLCEIIKKKHLKFSYQVCLKKMLLLLHFSAKVHACSHTCVFVCVCVCMEGTDVELLVKSHGPIDRTSVSRRMCNCMMKNGGRTGVAATRCGD